MTKRVYNVDTIYVKNVNQKYKCQFTTCLSWPRLGLRSPNVERNKNTKINLHETTGTTTPQVNDTS